MPKELFFDFFSPEQPVSLPHSRQKEVRVVVKRDDLIHPFISGNKWRKLKYALIRAREQKRSHLITFGGNWSNHVLATACAAASFGFRATAYIRGEQVDNPLLSLCRLYGLELVFVDRTAYRDKRRLFDENYGQDPDAFFIDEGGYSAEGALGCEEVISELKEQYDHIFVACGTGTTLAGISTAAAFHQPGATVHGVPVLKGGGFIRDAVESLSQKAKFSLHTEYHFGGYARTTPELIGFIKQFVSSTGMLIEPVYTGKLFFAVDDLLKRDFFRAGDSVLIIHSGGLTGFLGQSSKF
jgi:1-aminocyclopropane-1-carboxylate deaminase